MYIYIYRERERVREINGLNTVGRRAQGRRSAGEKQSLS